MKVSAVGNGHIESQPGFIQGGLDFGFLHNLGNRVLYASPSELRQFAFEHPGYRDSADVVKLSDDLIRGYQSELRSRYHYDYPDVAVATPVMMTGPPQWAGTHETHGVGDPISFDPDNPTGSLTNLLNLGINAGVGYVETEAGLRTPATSPTPGQVATPGATSTGSGASGSSTPSWLMPAAIGLGLVFLMKRK